MRRLPASVLLLLVGCFPKLDPADTGDTADCATTDDCGPDSGDEDDEGGDEDDEGGDEADDGDEPCTIWEDADGDGYGAGEGTEVPDCAEIPEGWVENDDDCDDTNADVSPNMPEICNGIDDDCDDDTDDADDDLDLTTRSTWYTDADTDGFGDAASPVSACAQPAGAVADATDCDDGASAVNPGATEVCNGVDDDCDGDVDDADASVDTSTGGTWYADSDSDGFGDAAAPVAACVQPAGTVTDATDCDDAAASINPAAAEICNSVDDDCDGDTDDADSSVDTSTGSTFYADADSDGYGDGAVTTQACSAPSGHVSDDTDCDDTDGDINPGAAEVCNGLDDDCDSTVDSAAACPCNLETNGGHTYLFCEDVSTWTAAETACEAFDNYQLAVVTDATEQAWIWATSASYDADRWWWLGLHNQSATAAEEPTGAFEWVDGSAYSYAPWYPYAPVQPDDYRGVEDCVHIDPSHGYWNDLDCGIDNWYGTQLYYICESTVP